MAQRETLDYVRADGTNVIRAWLDGFSEKSRPKVKARLDTRLAYIRTAPRVRNAYMEKLKGENDGIYEIKVSYRKVVYRILSCYGPGRGQITMLVPATEHNDRLKPPGVRRTAQERSADIQIVERTVLHDY